MQLKPNEVQTVKNIILRYCPTAKIILFGSRAKNTAKKYSDVDIAIIDVEKIALTKLTLMKEEFAESNLPYLVDIVDWQRITAEFQQVIQKTGIALN